MLYCPRNLAGVWAKTHRWKITETLISRQFNTSISKTSSPQISYQYTRTKIAFNENVRRFQTSVHSCVHKHSAAYTSINRSEDVKTLKLKFDVPITTKKVKRKILKAEHKDNIVGYGVADRLNLKTLQQDIESDTLYRVLSLPPDADDVLAVTAVHTPTEEERLIFYFKEGGVVFWKVSEIERMNELKGIRKHQRKSYKEDFVMDESDTLSFTYSPDVTKFDGCDVLLRTPHNEEEDMVNLLEKYTISKALVLSVKLSCMERFVESIADSMESITESMADGNVTIKKQDMLRQIAEIIQIKHFVNCTSDLLDTPDFLWDREALEILYMQARSEFDLGKRVQVLNKRLEHCGDLLENLKAQANDTVHLNVEYLIVILIAVEVLLELFGRSIKQFSAMQYENFKTWILSLWMTATQKQRALKELEDIDNLNYENRNKSVNYNLKKNS